MSLSAWERQALDSIKDDLAGSDPELATFLVTFNQLASGEEMPARENVRPGSRSPARRSGRIRLRLSLQQIVLLFWLVVSLTLIALAVVLSRVSGPTHCPPTLAAVACSAPAPAHSPPATSGGGG